MLPINNKNRVCVSIRIHTWFIRRPFFLHCVLLQLLSHEMQCIRAHTHTHDSRHSHSVKVKRIHCIKCQIVVIQRGRRYNVFVFFHNTHDVASDCRSMFICFLASEREWEKERELNSFCSFVYDNDRIQLQLLLMFVLPPLLVAHALHMFLFVDDEMCFSFHFHRISVECQWVRVCVCVSFRFCDSILNKYLIGGSFV